MGLMVPELSDEVRSAETAEVLRRVAELRWRAAETIKTIEYCRRTLWERRWHLFAS